MTVYVLDRPGVLHNYLVRHSAAKKRAGGAYFYPTDLATAYGMTPKGDPSVRRKIGIIELDGGYVPSEMAAYWAQLGFTATKPNIIPVSVDGATNRPGRSDADYEVVLDIQIAGGVCPNSDIYVFFAPNTFNGFLHAIQQAINTPGMMVVSISWGAPEKSWPAGVLSTFNTVFELAANHGITICAAAGDNGSSDGLPGNNCDFPSSSPYVLACGGTTLTCPSLTYGDPSTSERVWNSGGGATGGGYSAYFTKPAYQNGIVAGTRRGVPDVAGDADPNTGYVIYLRGGLAIVGGTSAVAPLWAGFLALQNHTGFSNPVLYNAYRRDRSTFHDILVGKNGTYTATTGWDPCVGLGTPSGVRLSSYI